MVLVVRIVITSIIVGPADRKSTRLNSSHTIISYAVFCLKKRMGRAPHLRGGRQVPGTGERGALDAGGVNRPPDRPWPREWGPQLGARLVFVFFLTDGAPPKIYALPPPPALPI